MPQSASPTAQSSSLDQSIRRLMRRSRVAIFLGRLLRWGAWLAASLGSVVLLLRAGFHLELPVVWPIYLVPLVGSLAAAIHGARRHGMSRRGASAWLDVHAGGSGRLLTAEELPDARWQGALEQALAESHELPVLRVKNPFLAALAGYGFLSLALLMRMPEPQGLGPSSEFIAGLTRELASKLESLGENIHMDEELAEELAERLGRIEDLADRAPTESLFEAMDRLEERMAQEGERAGEDLGQSMAELAEAMQSGNLDQATLEALLKQAAGLLASGSRGEELSAELAAMLAKGGVLPEGLDFSPAELMKLGEGLAGLMEGSMGELLGAGLLDASKLKLAEKFAKLENFLPSGHECDEECRAGG